MISSGRGNLAALGLERAKVAALDIYFNIHTTTPAFFDLLAPHIKSTGSYCVCAISTYRGPYPGASEFSIMDTPSARALQTWWNRL